MKTISIEIPAEWVKGVPTPVDDEPIKYKFKVGDEVMVNGKRYKISARCVNGCVPAYNFEGSGLIIAEAHISGYAPQDITERIKTFDDACRWCDDNDERDLVNEYTCVCTYIDSDDVIAYLKLRIITCALNEGWEPTFDEEEQRWYVYYHIEDGLPSVGSERMTFDLQKPASLVFKSERLAKYAAAWFYNIYADFCGYKEGGEE